MTIAAIFRRYLRVLGIWGVNGDYEDIASADSFGHVVHHICDWCIHHVCSWSLQRGAGVGARI